jgi:hypothetical protein
VDVCSSGGVKVYKLPKYPCQNLNGPQLHSAQSFYHKPTPNIPLGINPKLGPTSLFSFLFSFHCHPQLGHVNPYDKDVLCWGLGRHGTPACQRQYSISMRRPKAKQGPFTLGSCNLSLSHHDQQAHHIQNHILNFKRLGIRLPYLHR